MLAGWRGRVNKELAVPEEPVDAEVVSSIHPPPLPKRTSFPVRVLLVFALIFWGYVMFGIFTTMMIEKDVQKPSLTVAPSSVLFTEQPDEFSSNVKRQLAIKAENDDDTELLLIRRGSTYEIRLMTNDVLFPDNVDSDTGMNLSVTFKFDNQSQPTQSIWHMNIMRYNNAWYRGDGLAFSRAVFNANNLNLKTDKRGDIYRFDVSKCRAYADKFLK